MLTVVLVEPEVPANVGFVARTMACYGLSDLRIVARPDIAVHPEALRTVSGGESVLAAARSFADLSAAVADCTYALGFSRRTRDPSQRILDLPEAVNLVNRVNAPRTDPEPGLPVALVFGCESQGLSRDDTLRLSHLVRIRLADPTLSLNLSHAVAIALHAIVGTDSGDGTEARQGIGEWAAGSAPGRVPAALPISEIAAGDPATMAESDRILAIVLAALTERNLLRPAKAEAQADYLRILWRRLQPNRRELEFLAGLLKKMASSGPDTR